jgi:AcrR family transcriptional regulator
MSDLPAPPWRAQRRPRPRDAQKSRQPLSRDVIVDVALRIVDHEGIDGLSMRRVAQEFDTGPSSLYAHVANKEELLDLMVDKVTGEVPVPEPDPAHWQEQVKQMARDSLRVMAAHADLARATMANIPVGPNALRVSEGMLAIMIAGGLPPRVAAWALDRIFMYVSADAFEGALYGVKARASGKNEQEFAEEFFGQLREYFANLPPDRFPTISKHAETIVSGDGDERFEFGLDMLVDGLTPYVGKRH